MLSAFNRLWGILGYSNSAAPASAAVSADVKNVPSAASALTLVTDPLAGSMLVVDVSNTGTPLPQTPPNTPVHGKAAAGHAAVVSLDEKLLPVPKLQRAGFMFTGGRVESDDRKLAALQKELFDLMDGFRMQRRQIMADEAIGLVLSESKASDSVNVMPVVKKPWPWQKYNVNEEIEKALEEAAHSLHAEFCVLLNSVKGQHPDSNADVKTCDEAIRLTEDLDCFLNKIREIINIEKGRESTQQNIVEKGLGFLVTLLSSLDPRLKMILGFLPSTKSSDEEANADLELDTHIKSDFDKVVALTDKYVSGLMAVSRYVHQHMDTRIKAAKSNVVVTLPEAVRAKLAATSNAAPASPSPRHDEKAHASSVPPAAANPRQPAQANRVTLFAPQSSQAAAAAPAKATRHHHHHHHHHKARRSRGGRR